MELLFMTARWDRWLYHWSGLLQGVLQGVLWPGAMTQTIDGWRHTQLLQALGCQAPLLLLTALSGPKADYVDLEKCFSGPLLYKWNDKYIAIGPWILKSTIKLVSDGRDIPSTFCPVVYWMLRCTTAMERIGYSTRHTKRKWAMLLLQEIYNLVILEGYTNADTSKRGHRELENVSLFCLNCLDLSQSQ
mgnify:CR=1 FL=1